jgi:hypothetical protein
MKNIPLVVHHPYQRDAAKGIVERKSKMPTQELGFLLQTQCKSRVIAWRALLKSSANLSGEAWFALEKRVAQLKSLLTPRLVETKVSDLGASASQINAVTSAGASLRASIDAPITVLNMSEAFEAYHQAIVNSLTLTFSVSSEAIAAIENSINRQARLKSELG